MSNEAHAMGGQPLDYVVKCLQCGHQALVGVVVKHGQLPRFYCRECGERDDLLIERKQGQFRNFHRRRN